MLIRVRGGREGIAEYLVDGQKQGREFSRDELDERVIFDGDLELTDTIIKGMENKGERYLHITLAFKEDQINPEILKSITDDFKQFAMSAYETDEFNFYAEAHLPKIKSYVDKKMGILVERKPHIHIVIPEKNLLSGYKLNPFGLVEHQTRFLEAFQETINARYGLASPKENRRVKFTGESEMISRYKGDLFQGNAQALKERILYAVLDRKINNYDDFKLLLLEHGATRTRNAGTEKAYENVKPPGYAKGINLKDYVFTREFIEKSQADKIRFLSEDISHKYESWQAPRDPVPEHLALLKEWREVRAPQIKYINSGNRKLYNTFKKSDQDGKRIILAERAAKFYEKYRPNENQFTINEREITNARPNYSSINTSKLREGHRAALIYQSDLIKSQRREPPQSLSCMRNLSGISMVHRSEPEANVLLPSNARESMDQGRNADYEMRRTRIGDSCVSGQSIAKKTDSVLGQLKYDHQESELAENIDTVAEFSKIKRELDARQLLNSLSQTHGVMPEKYEITKSSDGSDRIKVGAQNLNVSDFLTKEMHLSFAEAAPILKREYERQHSQKADKLLPVQEPRRRLWDEYTEFHRVAAKPARNLAWEQQRQSERARRQAIKDEYAVRRAEILKNQLTTTADERKVAHSLTTSAKENAESELRRAITAERDALKVNGKLSREGYKDWLRDKAQRGDEKALAELRRQRDTACRRAVSGSIEDREKRNSDSDSDDEEDHEQTAPILRHIPFSVDRDGNVTYFADESKECALVVDSGEYVDVEDTEDDQAIEIGLRLAVQKWGREINVTGSEEFKERCARVAAELGIDVVFNEKRLNEFFDDRKGGIETAQQQQAERGALPVPAQSTSQREQTAMHNDDDDYDFRP